MLAFAEIGQSGAPGISFEPVAADPGGDPARYPELSASLLGQGIRHVVGCYTSSSRKDVIPQFEKHDALLWYPSHYEGFESSNNVIYTGAAPNQHIIPLMSTPE
jgi:branched-chain amino acid transport system substrate-binding protein